MNPIYHALNLLAKIADNGTGLGLGIGDPPNFWATDALQSAIRYDQGKDWKFTNLYVYRPMAINGWGEFKEPRGTK